MRVSSRSILVLVELSLSSYWTLGGKELTLHACLRWTSMFETIGSELLKINIVLLPTASEGKVVGCVLVLDFLLVKSTMLSCLSSLISLTNILCVI